MRSVRLALAATVAVSAFAFAPPANAANYCVYVYPWELDVPEVGHFEFEGHYVCFG